ncbi:hypothetical protein ACFYKX_17395 [Cytobacillus sp. FJAT-54145]|uniref:Spore coat protein n=1 Tax=Cytobacillus spartinae TaxID=3299023 RepID=A0ABW6KHN0_9BACI
MHYYRTPHPGNQRFFFGGPFIGGLLGGVAGGLLGAAAFYPRPRPFPVYGPYGYGGFGPGPFGPGYGPFFY